MKKTTPSKVVIVPHPPVPPSTTTTQCDTVSTAGPAPQPAPAPENQPENGEKVPDNFIPKDKD